MRSRKVMRAGTGNKNFLLYGITTNMILGITFRPKVGYPINHLSIKLGHLIVGQLACIQRR